MNAMHSVIIKPTGEELPTTPKDGKCFTLEELQTIVGGYIEIVQLKHGLVIVVNEDGISKELLPNLNASKLAGCDIRGTTLVTTRKGAEYAN